MPTPPPDETHCPSQTQPTSVKDAVSLEGEDRASSTPVLQVRGELRWGDVQVDGDEGDAQEADLDPPLPHPDWGYGAPLTLSWMNTGHTINWGYNQETKPSHTINQGG